VIECVEQGSFLFGVCDGLWGALSFMLLEQV